MALPHRPHLIIVYRNLPIMNGNIQSDVNEWREVYRFRGMITTKTASEAQVMFGQTVSRPGVVMGNLSDGGDPNNPNVLVGDRLSGMNAIWNVESPLEFHDAERTTSHIRCLLNRNLPDSKKYENA